MLGRQRSEAARLGLEAIRAYGVNRVVDLR
jgi:hypothetical protein